MINLNLVISEKMAARFKGDVELFERYLGQLAGELMKQEAALTALAAIKFQAPIPSQGGRASGDGLGVPAKKQGELAVERDIRNIFRTNEDTKPNELAFATHMQNFIIWKNQPYTGRSEILRKIHADGNFLTSFDRVRAFVGRKAEENLKQTFKKVYLTGSEMRAAHEEQRRIYKGRIYANNGPSPEVKASPYIVQKLAMKNYIKQRTQRVGFMKAGWASVIQRIGMVNINGKKMNPAGGKVPQWVKRHGAGGGGRVNTEFTASKKRVVILNEIGNVDGIAISWDVARKVLDFRNISINSRPYQADVDKAVSLWNQGRIQLRT